MLLAPINRILPYSVVDGPGNRVVVFFQRCNIHCVYCHNPETLNLCSHCGDCLAVCPTGALEMVDGKMVWDMDKCCACDACIQQCKHFSTPKIKNMTPEQVFAQVRKSMPFIRGLTTSGGECSLYPDFLRELFTLAKAEGLNCLMDVNGTVRLRDQEDLMEVCDGVMLDVKAWDSQVHKQLVGLGNEIVKENLVFLAENEKLSEVRIVYLPDMVDASDVICGIADLLKPTMISDLPLKLIRFRSFGVRGKFVNAAAPSMRVMQELKQLAEDRGFKQVRIL